MVVAGAIITATSKGPDSISATTVTDATGSASIDLLVSQDVDSPTRVDIEVSAEGYGTFTCLSVPVSPGNGPNLTPVLRKEAQIDDLGQPAPPVRPAQPPGVASPSTGSGRTVIPRSRFEPTVLLGAAMLAGGLALGRSRRT